MLNYYQSQQVEQCSTHSAIFVLFLSGVYVDGAADIYCDIKVDMGADWQY